jgi:hypothetical protein
MNQPKIRLVLLLYNGAMAEKEARIYTPELQSRRPELVSWGLALASLVGLLILNLGGAIFFWAIVFVCFLFFAALSISLGNWVDRKTQIKIADSGITFQNGLRNVELPWFSIRSVTTSPSRWGEKIQVVGEKSHFEFNTLGEVTFQKQLQGRVGFQQGNEIRDEIIQKSGLTSVAKKGELYYYSRS